MRIKIGTSKILLYFYLITIIIKLSINNISEEYNIKNINNKLFDNKKIIEKDFSFKLNNKNKFTFKDKDNDNDNDSFSKSENLEENEFNSYEFEYNKISQIQNINTLPFYIFCKIPFKDQYNSTLLFNFYFTDKNDNNKTLYKFDDFTMNTTIINKTVYEEIQNLKINDENIFKVKDKRNNSIFDLTTKSVILKFNKNNLAIDNKENEDIYLFAKIDNNKINKTNFNLDGNIILINDHYYNHVIPKNNYINNKIYYDVKETKNNFDLYHLQLDNEEDTFSVDFCSDYALSRGIYVSFLDYDNSKILNYDDITKNSSNIIFNLKSRNKKGKIYHFEFNLKNKKKDILFCVYSQNKPIALDSYNYIFKYNTYKKDGVVKFYELNNEIKNTKNADKTKLIFDNIKIIKKKGDSEECEYLEGEIYIRKIINNKKKKREELDTIGIIESKYELVKGLIRYTDKNDKIEIEIPKIDEHDYYSVFINLPSENEKFVYNTINIPKGNRNYIYVILIFTAFPLYLGIVIAVILFALKYKNSELKENILKTSFQESGVVGKLVEDDDNDNNDDN